MRRSKQFAKSPRNINVELKGAGLTSPLLFVPRKKQLLLWSNPHNYILEVFYYEDY